MKRFRSFCARLCSKKLLPAWALALAVLTALAAPRPLRLHVIADSDAAEDQTVKLAVRDAVLEQMNALGPVYSTAEARSLVLSHGAELQQAAENTLRQKGFSYGARLYLGPSLFPDRNYGGRFYPAGRYEALRVVLGSGQGQNWWCVIYPPLCLGALEEAEAAEAGEPLEVEFRSFLAELFHKLFSSKGGTRA